jgi:hypothetical protein
MASHAYAETWCIVGKQSCDYIALAEFGLDAQAIAHAGTEQVRPRTTVAHLGLGVVLPSRFGVSVGARQYFYPMRGGADVYWMASGRYRWWLTHYVAVDAAVAPLIHQWSHPGLTLQVSATYADQVAIVASVDALRVEVYATNPGVASVVTAGLGIRFVNFASVPGLLTTWAAALAMGD